jgi:hypothetical protein
MSMIPGKPRLVHKTVNCLESHFELDKQVSKSASTHKVHTYILPLGFAA